MGLVLPKIPFRVTSRITEQFRTKRTSPVTAAAIGTLSCAGTFGFASDLHQTDVAFYRLDHVVEPACKYLLGETQCVTLCRVERDVRRQRKCVGVDDGIDDNWSVLVGQSFCESVFHVAGFFEADAFCAH